MFAKASWTGTITFGLVSVPVKLYGATEDHGVTLHRTHATCELGEYGETAHRVSQAMVCKDCEETVPYAEMGSCHVDADGTTVVLSKDELDSLPNVKSREINVVSFVEPAEVDPLRYGKPYYIRPDYLTKKRTDKPRPNRAYLLLVEALRRSDKVMIGRMVMRSRESLVAITVSEDLLVARVLLWADELRAAEFAEPEAPVVTVSEEEIAQACELVSVMVDKFDIESYTDAREQALEELIASKRPVMAPVDAGAQIIDLTARLNVAVAAHAG